MDTAGIAAMLVLGADWVLRIALAVRVIMRRRAVGVSLSWLSVILLFPFVGSFVYVFLGENRLGNRRALKAIAIRDTYRYWLRSLAAEGVTLGDETPSMVGGLCRQAEKVVGMPALPDNRLQLLERPDDIFCAMVRDIEQAEHRCHLEFYIWTVGGSADDVVDALIDAAGRGVACRVLVDAVGSGDFLGSKQVGRLRSAGVRVEAALPVNVFRALFRRLDLRNHRKIMVIDGRVAYTGSQNIADPKLFKSDQGVGQWIDAMVRVEGRAVEALEGIFLTDWELETGDGFDILRETEEEHPPPAEDGAVVQVVPSGPGFRGDAIHHLLLTSIYAAQRDLVMTTPYFVPDESMMDALVTASHRGVRVTLIVPERPDSVLVRLASRSHYCDLLDAGVRIMVYQGGLLHTKVVTVDEDVCLIGSVNLDMRSFWLNFEVTLFVYDETFTRSAGRLQETYMNGSREVRREEWERRPMHWRLIENTARLTSPLL